MGAILAIAMAFLLAAPAVALADQKKSSSGKDTPTENVGMNFGKVENTYQTNKPAPKSGVNGGSAPKGGTRH